MKLLSEDLRRARDLGHAVRRRACRCAGKIVVWWVKGFYPSEDAALYEAVKKFEAKTGVKVELSQYAVQDGIPKTVAALDSGNPPDVAYIDVYDFQVLGKWAYDGKLEDLSDVLTPIKGNFLPNTLETTFLYNDKTKKRSYYGFPIKQQTMHIEYWKDMLAEAGIKPEDIPGHGRSTGTFWCDKAQVDYRKKTGKRIFGTGFPMGVDSSDSFYSFLTFMDAYNVKLVDADGKLTVSRSQGAGGSDRRAARLHAALHQGLHAPIVDVVEGSGQQCRIPQQDDDHDAQRDDLDRGKVVRRH
mgnify:CR=1 FL=1